MAEEFWSSQAIAAFTGFSGVVVGALISWGVQARLLGRRIDADEHLAQTKFDFDKELAQRKFDQERAQLIHKRQFDLAETLLADAYRLRDLIGYVRNGFSFGNEGETRKAGEGETEHMKRLKDSYFVPIERLQKEGEFISGFMAKQHPALAHFGPDAAKAFQLFADSLNRVQVASHMLIDMAGQSDNNPDFTHQMRGDIWANYAMVRKKEDEIGQKVEQAVSLFERLCKPVLEWKGA